MLLLSKFDKGVYMNKKERMLAILNGDKPDKIPFVMYDDGPHGEPVQAAYDLVGRENVGLLTFSDITRYHYKECKLSSEKFVKKGIEGIRNFIHTPKGTLSEDVLIEPVYRSQHRDKNFVVTRADLDILLWLLRNTEVHENYDRYNEDLQRLGDDGIPMATVSRTAFQRLWIKFISIVDLSYHMADYPDIMEECIDQLNKNHIKQFEIIGKAIGELPIHYVNIPDNITAPMIGEERYRKYCMPMYEKLHDIIAGRAKLLVHMDGDLKPLWKAIGESRIDGIDSFSPPPANDTSVAQAISMWPDKLIFLNFPSSVHLAAPSVIYDKTIQLLNEGADSGRMWIQISENVPPDMWKKSYVQIVNAINDWYDQ